MKEDKEFFKVKFLYDSNGIGRSVWVSEIKVFDACTADELQKKIDAYINSDFKEFRRKMQVSDINKM